MSDLLVTGGAGFIGVNLVRWWLNRNPGDSLTVLDSLTYAGNAHSIEDLVGRSDFEFVHGDIRDTNLVTRILGDRNIDVLVHLAAESHVDRSIEGPDAFIDTNVVGTHSLLKAAKTVW